MVKAQDGTEIYENQIEQLFHQFFAEKGIDLEKDAGSIKQTKYKAAFKYVYNNLFKPDENTVRLNNRNSKIDYRDIKLLNKILDIFIYICLDYNIVVSIDNFSALTGITTQTMYTWERGEYRGNVYYDDNDNVIDDINEYKANNKGGYREEATSAYSDFVQKIRRENKEFYKLNLSDTPVGQITIANNDRDTGLMYAQVQAQVQAEAFGKPQISMQELKQLRDKRRELPQKPELD